MNKKNGNITMKYIVINSLTLTESKFQTLKEARKFKSDLIKERRVPGDNSSEAGPKIYTVTNWNEHWESDGEVDLNEKN